MSSLSSSICWDDFVEVVADDVIVVGSRGEIARPIVCTITDACFVKLGVVIVRQNSTLVIIQVSIYHGEGQTHMLEHTHLVGKDVASRLSRPLSEMKRAGLVLMPDAVSSAFRKIASRFISEIGLQAVQSSVDAATVGQVMKA